MLFLEKSFSKRNLARFKSGRTYTSSQKKSSRFNSFITHIKPAKTKVETFVSYGPELKLQAAAPETLKVV